MKDTANSKRLLPLLLGVVLVLALASTGVLGYILWNDFHTPSRIQSDFEIKYGSLPDKSPEDVQKLLDTVVEEGMVNMVINAEPVFDAKTMEGNIDIENIEANHYNQQVEIRLDGTDEVLASSDLIKPGQYVDKITLAKQLDPGEYSATAIFTTSYPDKGQEPLAKSSLKLKLIVQ